MADKAPVRQTPGRRNSGRGKTRGSRDSGDVTTTARGAWLRQGVLAHTLTAADIQSPVHKLGFDGREREHDETAVTFRQGIHVPMSKKSKKATASTGLKTTLTSEDVDQAERAPAQPSMKRKDYEKQMRRLQGELVAMQEWVKSSGAKVCIVFEGLDSAGKGGTIRRITERTSPRVFKHVALPTPTEREKSQMYIQRYIAHFPCGRRGRHLRPELVQPCRRRAGDGLLHPGGEREVPRAGAGGRASDGRQRDHLDQVLAQRQRRGADPYGSGTASRTPARSGSSPRPT